MSTVTVAVHVHVHVTVHVHVHVTVHVHMTVDAPVQSGVRDTAEGLNGKGKAGKAPERPTDPLFTERDRR